jgi:hypothetical protein
MAISRQLSRQMNFKATHYDELMHKYIQIKQGNGFWNIIRSNGFSYREPNLLEKLQNGENRYQKLKE